MAREKVIALRLSDEEHEILTAAAKYEGMTLGTYLRTKALAAARAEPTKRKPKK